MKKIYASLAVAATVSAQAFAGVNSQKTEIFTRATDYVMTEKLATGEKINGPMKAPAAKPNDNAAYAYDCINSKEGGGPESSALYLEFNGADVTIYGLFELAPVKGKYNAAAGTIRVESQPIFYKYQNESIYLYPKHLEWDEQGKPISDTYVPYIEFTYMPQGVQLQNGSVICVGGWFANDGDEIEFTVPSLKGAGSGFGWYYMNRLKTIEETYGFPYFQYDAAEWTDCDDASLEDGWFKALDGVGYPAYNVKCQKNKANEKEILLVNPYGPNSPYAQVNASSNKDGYILLNIEDPDCVLVRPYVNANFDLSKLYQVSELANPIFACNKEGYLNYVEGWTYEEIKEDAEAFDDPMSTMTADGVVTIPNARIQGDMGAYLLATQWEAEGGIPIEMISTIKLPANALAVKGIINDAENVPARYFNLQGVEIANPEAGQVVIVKKGNEAFKTIAK